MNVEPGKLFHSMRPTRNTGTCGRYVPGPVTPACVAGQWESWQWSVHWFMQRGWSIHWFMQRGWSICWFMQRGVECPLWPTPGFGGLAWKSESPGLDIASGTQSLSSYAAVIQNQGNRASTYPHAKSRGLPGGDIGSCTSLVLFWLRLTKALS